MKFSRFFFFALLCAGLAHCSKDAPLAAGTMQADDPEATQLFQKAKNQRDAGEARRARKNLEELVEYHPLAREAPEALLMTGDIWYQSGEPVDAFEAYNKLIADYPSSPLYATALKRQEDLAFGAADGNVTYNLLWMFNTKVDSSQTVDMLTKLRDNAPHAPSAPKALLKLGEVYERSEAQDQAIEAYHKLIDNYPQDKTAPLAQFAVGRNLLSRMEEGNRNKSNLKAAQEAFEDFLQRYPKHELVGKVREMLNDVRYRLASMNLDIARFYRKSGDWAPAVYYYQEAANDPYNAEVRGQAAAELKEMGVAVKKNKPNTPPPAPARS